MKPLQSLSPQVLALYARGQVQIRDHHQKKLHIGSIKIVQVTEAGEIVLSLDWLAEADQYYPTQTWTYDERQEIRLNLSDYEIFDFGKHRKDTESRLSVANKGTGPSLLLFSAEMPNKLDARSIKGLPAKAA